MKHIKRLLKKKWFIKLNKTLEEWGKAAAYAIHR